MIRSTMLLSLIALGLTAYGFAAEPKELTAARTHYTQASPHPGEAERESYVTSLVRLRAKLARGNDPSGWRAVDAEIVRHPASPQADSKALTEMRIGQWDSPRHSYLYRKNGTWVMLLNEPDATHGEWRIEGNRYFDSAKSDALSSRPYKLVLLTKKDFVFTDGTDVFYETRASK